MEEDGKFIVLTKCGKLLIIDDECSLLFRQICLTVRFTSQSNQNKYILQNYWILNDICILYVE